MPRKPKAPPWARGYGHSHRVLRERIREMVEHGAAVCTRCGVRIQPGERWHLDHRDDRQGYSGAAHAYCNTAAGGAKRQELRRETAAKKEPRAWSRVWSDVAPPEGATIRGLPLAEYIEKHGDDSGEAAPPHIW
jgi:hypothetical protein